MPGASRSVRVAVPVEQFFDVVADYERYGEFLPEVKSVRLTDRRGPEVKVHYQVNLIKNIRYTLQMKEERPHRIAWSFVEGEVMRDNRGEWRLEADGPAATKVTYQIEMAFGPLVPRAITDKLVESSLPAMLEAFRKRAESGKTSTA